MPRPTKNITTKIGDMSKADIDKRLEYKPKLKEDSDKIKVSTFLNFKSMV